MARRPKPNVENVKDSQEQEDVTKDIDSMGGFLTHARTARMAPKLQDDFERIIEHVFVAQPFQEYERLEKELTIGPDRSDLATLQKAMDEAEDNSRSAHRLYVTACVERDRWEIDQEAVLAGIRTQAVASLEQEKREGLRTKQITDADVTSKMAALFPDEYRHAVTRVSQVKKMVEHTEHLVKCWMSRCSSIRTLLDSRRR